MKIENFKKFNENKSLEEAEDFLSLGTVNFPSRKQFFCKNKICILEYKNDGIRFNELDKLIKSDRIRGWKFLGYYVSDSDVNMIDRFRNIIGGVVDNDQQYEFLKLLLIEDSLYNSNKELIDNIVGVKWKKHNVGFGYKADIYNDDVLETHLSLCKGLTTDPSECEILFPGDRDPKYYASEAEMIANLIKCYVISKEYKFLQYED